RARLGAHGLCRLLVHRDHVRSLDELETVRVDPGRAEEDDLDPLRGSVQRARDDLIRRPGAPPRVPRAAAQHPPPPPPRPLCPDPPGRPALPPGGARLRRRLAPLAAPGSPSPYHSYCPLRP